jgi:uncharacterized protein with beta-barrel porin domain
VTVSQTGHLIAMGDDSTALLAQSDATGSMGDITVNILNRSPSALSVIAGGGGAGAGVKILGGADNQLNNDGLITNASATNGKAIIGTKGNTTVNNRGVVVGSVDLGSGQGAFRNHVDSAFLPGGTVNLGGGRLSNGGVLAPGAAGKTQTTVLTGDMAQDATGTYAAEIDAQSSTGEADQIIASGTAVLAGNVAVGAVNRDFALPGTHQATILSAAGGTTNSGLALVTRPSAVISYQMLFPNSNDVAIGYTIDYSPASGLNRNQAAIGNNVNSIQLAGGSPSFAPVAAALFDVPDSAALAAAYDQLSAEGYLATETSALYANEGFNNALLSCRVRDGEYWYVREGECGWIRLSKGIVDQEATTENFGFHQDANYFSAGFQRTVGSGWHAGLGIAYQDSDIDVNSLSSTRGEQLQIGAVVKGRTGGTTYSAAVTFGQGWYDTDRYVNIPTPGVVASSNQRVGLFGARLRLAHAWPLGKGAYVRPMIDAALTYARFNGFNEEGAGGADLQVAGRSETWVSVVPAVELGGEVELADHTLVRPSVKLGVTQFASGTDPSITASFSGAPAGVAPFTVTGAFDRTYLDVDAGVDVLSIGGAVLRVGYLGRFSQHVSANGATLKFSLSF